jgi:hypothetical protein
MVFRCRFFHARVYRGRHFVVLSARRGMVGSPEVRVGAANDPVACRRGVGDRYRNTWRSRTDCGLARASFRLVVSERRSADILKLRRGGLRRISPSCRGYYAERELAPSDVRGRNNTLINLIAVTAKMAKTKRSPYSR